MTMCNYLKIVDLGDIFVCIKLYPLFYNSFFGAKYEQKSEPVPLVFNTQGVIVTRRIKKYTCFNSKFYEKSDGDVCVFVELLCLTVFDFYKPLWSLFCWL